jgi:phosphohistidine swiveling domain-containing protein
LTNALPSIAVPPGFVVTTDAFSSVLRRNRQAVRSLCAFERLFKATSSTENPDFRPLFRAAGRVRKEILKLSIPGALRSALFLSYEKLAKGVMTSEVAVRSSATCEDSLAGAAAGQFTSVLHVKNSNQLLSALGVVWASAFSDRAIAYMLQRRVAAGSSCGPHKSPFRMAVLVQQMIHPAAASGVAFSVDPRSGRPGILVEALHGEGEKLVSGQATPDRWLIAAGGGKILEFEPSKSETCLREKEVLAIAESVNNINNHFKARGWKHVDTEFVVRAEDRRLFFVQARPETATSRSNESAHYVGILPEEARRATLLVRGGATGCSGAASGRLLIAASRHETQRRVRPGDILVTVETTPEWTPLFLHLSGLVTERGGIMSHAAICSRESKLPCIVACENARQKLKGFACRTVTLDSHNCAIYEGRLPIIEAPRETLLRPELGQSNENQTTIVHRRDRHGEWIGKPEYPLGRWQRELYLRAWELVGDIYGCPVRADVKNDVIYVRLEDLRSLERDLSRRPHKELGNLLDDRKSALQQFVGLASTFRMTSGCLQSFYRVYTRLIAHFHVRWSFNKVAHGLLQQALAGLPEPNAATRSQLFAPGLTESRRMLDDYASLLKRAAHHPHLFETRKSGLLISDLALMAPEVWRHLLAHAKNFKYCSDDIREPVPVLSVLKQLQRDISRRNRGAAPSERRVASAPGRVADVSAVLPSGNVRRLAELYMRQLVMKENEHHLQVRAQWRIRAKLLAGAASLVNRGILRRASVIWATSPFKLQDWLQGS